MSRIVRIAQVDERIVRTRNKIAGAVVRLGSTKPVDHLKVGEVCREAGISRSTFYGHFFSLGEYFEKSYANMLAGCALRGSCDERGKGKPLAVHRILDHMNAASRYAVSVDRSRYRPGMYAAGELRLIAIIKQNLAMSMSGLSDEECDTAATFIAGGFTIMLRQWISGGLTESPDEFTRKFDDMCDALLRGLVHPVP